MLQTIHDNWRSSETIEGASAIPLHLVDKHLKFKGDKKEMVEFIQHVGGSIDNK